MQDLLFKNAISSVVAVIVTTATIACAAYICSGFSASWAMYIGGACILLTPFYRHLWNRPDMRQQDLSGWIHSFSCAWGVLSVLLLGDVLIGKLGDPAATFWQAAASTAAFYAIVFLSPLGPATLSGLIRAYLHKRFNIE